ncbi:hypothetical protein A3D14_02390 [Candidatus Saccharibacteria bacterium RIFCSPHIGHO2_02_FULL_47_12]|nr:MAG: hypothetical protein A3D14_02390 [Candidatus Saccharibacteria bacterium RIFCSPHIGHO2_02_FULL_47_12]
MADLEESPEALIDRAGDILDNLGQYVSRLYREGSYARLGDLATLLGGIERIYVEPDPVSDEYALLLEEAGELVTEFSRPKSGQEEGSDDDTVRIYENGYEINGTIYISSPSEWAKRNRELLIILLNNSGKKVSYGDIMDSSSFMHAHSESYRRNSITMHSQVLVSQSKSTGIIKSGYYPNSNRKWIGLGVEPEEVNETGESLKLEPVPEHNKALDDGDLGTKETPEEPIAETAIREVVEESEPTIIEAGVSVQNSGPDTLDPGIQESVDEQEEAENPRDADGHDMSEHDPEPEESEVPEELVIPDGDNTEVVVEQSLAYEDAVKPDMFMDLEPLLNSDLSHIEKEIVTFLIRKRHESVDLRDISRNATNVPIPVPKLKKNIIPTIAKKMQELGLPYKLSATVMERGDITREFLDIVRR